MDYTPIVLKNKGVPIELAVAEKQDDGSWRRRFNEEGDFDKETVYVRFTHNTIADIEETYGSLEKWQELQDTKQSSTMRETLALCLRRDKEHVGEAMIEGKMFEYTNAVAVAWSICNGVDPTTASRLLRQASQLAEEQRKSLNAAMMESMGEEKKPSRGKTGSSSGRKQEDPS
jgi:hypothetical protein